MKSLCRNILIGLILTSLLISACTESKLKVRVATDATWPPFESINQNTQAIEGFDVDLLNAIAEKEGLQIEYINVAFDPLLVGIGQCQYDAAISSITIKDDRKKSMLFSDPYFAAGQIVTVRKDNTDIMGKDSLKGKNVGAQIQTTGADEVAKIQGANLKIYDDISLAFKDLMNGQIDAIVTDNPLALIYVSTSSDKLKIVGKIFTDEYYGIAVCKTNQTLLSRINKGLAAVKAEGLIDQLTQKWLPR